MYKISTTNKFEKDAVKCFKRGLDFSDLDKATELLEATGTVPSKYKPHILSGNFTNHWEGHLLPDWLLIWKIDRAANEITLVRTGTHSDLF